MTSGRNLRSVRRQNTDNVIKLLVMEKSLSRKQISNRLGLTKMTVGNIVNDLMEQGYVTETRDTGETHTIGPKPTVISIVPKSMVAVGVHITSTVLSVLLVDIVDGILMKRVLPVDNQDSNQQLLHVIAEMLADVLSDSAKHNIPITGIGVTYDGVVDQKSGKILINGSNVEKEEIAIKSILEKKFNLPTFVGSEVEGAAIAELVYGKSIHADSVYYLDVSSVIRGTFISGDSIVDRCFGMSGEIGHMSVKYDGPLCICGSRGCYQLYGSIGVLLEKSKCRSIEELSLKVQDRDPLSLRTLEDFIQITSVVFANIVHLYNPKCILVSGEITKLEHYIFKEIERLVNQRILLPKHKYVKVVVSDLKEIVNQMGAAMIVFGELFM